MAMPPLAMALGALMKAPEVTNDWLGMFKTVQDLRDSSNTSDALQKLEQFKTSADAAAFQPDGYMKPESRLVLNELRKKKLNELYGQEAAPISAEASRLNSIAANDPTVGSPEGMADFAQRPDFWLGADNTGVIPSGKKGVATAAGANPEVARLVQSFAAGNQNILDAFRAGQQDPMALARLVQNKELAGNFKDVQTGANYLRDDATAQAKTAAEEKKRFDELANLRNFSSSVAMLSTPSERTGKLMPFGEAAALVNQAAADYPVPEGAINNTIDNLLAQYEKTRRPTSGKTGRTEWTGTVNELGDINKDVSSVAPVTNVYNNPVAQTQFVDPTTGKPLVFDKKSGTYKVANVEGSGAVKNPTPAVIDNTVKQQTAVDKAQEAYNAAKNNPKAFGVKNYLGDTIRQRTDPKGVAARAAVADLGSTEIKTRSGTAVTASEFPRIRPFIPLPTDSAATVKTKTKRFIEIAREEQKLYDAALKRAGIRSGGADAGDPQDLQSAAAAELARRKGGQ